MQLSTILSSTLVLLLAPLALAVPLDNEAKILPRTDYRIYVGNLSFAATSDEISHIFAQSGHVVNVHIVTDRETGKPRGFAFVTMGSAAEASKAVSHWDGRVPGDSYNGNRPLQVRVCTPKLCLSK